MELNLILGTSKTGKSKYIYDCIKECVDNESKVILFVPSQKRFLAENEYMKNINENGIIGVDITTIDSYITEKISNFSFHIQDKKISKLDKKIIITKILKDNEDILTTFRKVKDKEGFLDSINNYIDLFRKNNIDVNVLKNLDIKDENIKRKLIDISNIYELFLTEINKNFVDNVDEAKLLFENISKIHDLDKSYIFFDGYNNFNQTELNFIESLLQIAKKTYITLTTDITKIEDIYLNNTSDIFEVSNQTFKNLLKVANDVNSGVNLKINYINYSKSNDDLKYLAENLFKDNYKKTDIKFSNIFLSTHTNEYKEIENVASIIKQKVINEGYKYNDFCIYTTNKDEYSSIISRVFFEYNINFYSQNKENITKSKLLNYILNYLSLLVYGINKDILLETLKLGFTNLDDKDIFMLQRYMTEFNINKYNIFKEFIYNNENKNDFIYDLEILNNLREYIVKNYTNNLKEKENTVKEYIKMIYDHLIKNDILLNYEKLLNYMEQKENIINDVNIKRQVYDKIIEVFDSIAKVYNDCKITLEEFLNIFKMSIKDITLKSVPPTLDEVEVIDIDVEKTTPKKQVFFIGVCENRFPKKVSEDLIFSDDELNTLKDKNDITFKENSVSKLNMEYFNIYEALNNTIENLYISIPSLDVANNALRKSSLVTSIENMTGLKIYGDISTNDEKSILDKDFYSKDKLFEKLVYNIKEIENNINKNKIDDKSNKEDNIKKIESLLAIYNIFLEDNSYRELLEYIKDDNNLSQEVIDDIYQKALITSVSKLEKFRKCPFSYYINYILKLKENKEFEITSLDSGSFMHNVLDDFSTYLQKNNIAWQMILDDGIVLNEKYKNVLKDIILNELDVILKKQKESVKYEILKQKFINTMQKVVQIIAISFNQSEFKPYGYEIEFKDGSVFLPITLKIDDNHEMKIIGKIDRADILNYKDKSYVRIVDYKSSDKTLDIDKIKEGISLQLVTYLKAFIDNLNENENNGNEKKYLPAGMLYFNLSDRLVTLSDYTQDEDIIKSKVIEKLRMKGIFLKDVTILEMMDKKLGDTKERLIDISKSTVESSIKNGKKTKKALDEEEFNNLLEMSQDILIKLGKEVLTGNVKINPYKKEETCKYCKYSSICRKNSIV